MTLATNERLESRSDLYEYTCTILRWIDGDSCEVVTDLGFHISVRQTVRVYGINTPETHTKNVDEKQRGLAAKAFAESLAPVGSKVTIKSHKADDTDKYNRWLADITMSDGSNFGSIMIRDGHAKEYFGIGVKPV